ncbi:AI-2E family transporter [Moraxella cuniculi]|nr:AI-2E family transporter [Moraxella cuniculi]
MHTKTNGTAIGTPKSIIGSSIKQTWQICHRWEDFMTTIQAQKSFILMAMAVFLLMVSFYYLIHVWLIVFASILMAVFLLSLVEFLTKIPVLGRYARRLPHGVLLTLVVLFLLGIFVGFAATFGHELANQLEHLKQMIPQAFDYLHQYVQSYPMLYEWLQNQAWIERLRSDPQGFLAQFGEGAMTHLPTYLGGVISGIGTFVVIVILGLFLAISPAVYRRSFVAMIPKNSRNKAEYLLERSYRAMQQWLVGQLVVMGFVGVSTGVALWLMDIPFALALGFIAFLLDFVPVLGPWLSAVPIVLLTLIVAPDMLLWVVIMIVAVQQLESYVVAPIVQNRMVDLPPVALLLPQVVMGSITGFLGVALAAPMMVMIIVWVQVLYIKFTLGDYTVQILDQDEEQMKNDLYADFQGYQQKQTANNPAKNTPPQQTIKPNGDDA